ncbi:protein tis11 [Anaeramoeba flamelloides]|uniref:Protein tis11 n=1 Tax=Anaeramoeba flamelloides TaxID=1746091 RepID=A0AAV7ZGZ5_9EUKA|nr:protein tis11 [Anaeramoeba flamelloides]
MINNNEPILVDQRIPFEFYPQSNFTSHLQTQQDLFLPIDTLNNYGFIQSTPRRMSPRSPQSKSPKSPNTHHTHTHQTRKNRSESPKHNHTRNTQNLKYKTEVCRNFFGEGCFCEFGKRCNFIHHRDNPESIALGSIHALKMLGLSYRVTGIHPNQTQRKKKRLSIFRSLGQK